MVTVLILLAVIGQAAETRAEAVGPTGRDPTRAVGSALGKGDFPWYDAQNDAIKPLQIPVDPAPRTQSSSGRSPLRVGWKLGDIISFVGFSVALAVLIGLLVWFWRIYEPVTDALDARSPRGPGTPTRVEELPAGLRGEFSSSDPWEEALRRRHRGDLAGAIICLFAHQLLTLSRLGLVRLAPGRTGRQLLRAVSDAEFRGLVQPTLRLFEAAYYGHRPPSADEFAAAWTRAEAFEQRVAAGGVS